MQQADWLRLKNCEQEHWALSIENLKRLLFKKIVFLQRYFVSSY